MQEFFRKRGKMAIGALMELLTRIVTPWRTARSGTPPGVVGVAAVVAADPSPPLSNTYAPPREDFTMARILEARGDTLHATSAIGFIQEYRDLSSRCCAIIPAF
ncbi:hypothetical protein ACFW04_010257 [Cataglyphis niger]